ncbi:hypothetical protein LRAMOSA01299 [Lichtheimia ramosa]|uniref:Amino acid transporter transmembrane domain-containing protein n=1 Tax=Lichtheimia ramosa TaxID=688394 RepID=A0A077WJ20_9FUNG|nr:hypothetical protein LRAMOSA01299 [Lichtheimia ramosa]
MSGYGSTRKHLSKAEQDLLQAHQPGFGTRTKTEVAFNLVNATVGAGIIGLPFAMAHMGFFLGIVTSIWVAVACQLGLYMLILAGKETGIYKFAPLVEHVMGRFGFHILNMMIVLQAGGACVSYFILIGDTLPLLFDRYLPQFPILSDRTFVVAIIGTCCILPLHLRRSIGSLAKWSMISVMCLPIVVFMIILRAPAYYTAPPEWTWVGNDASHALGIMAFSFACSQVAFNNFLTLKDQSPFSWCQSTALATGMSWTVSITFAIVGYTCFGDNVQPNLFMNFDSNDGMINIGRFLLAITMIFTIPMGIFPTREAIHKTLGFETPSKQPNQWQHYIVTLVVFTTIMVLGMTVKSLGKVYSLAGGIAATTLAYILPGICYLVTRWKSTDHPYYVTVQSARTISNEERYLVIRSGDMTDSISEVVDDTSTAVDEELESMSCSAAKSMENPKIGCMDVMGVLLVLWGMFVMASAVI